MSIKRSVACNDVDLAQVAELYYLHGKRQEDIAQILKRTRQDIGRMLKKAEENGVVKVSILGRERYEDLRQLEIRLRRLFPLLQDVAIVTGLPADPDKIPTQSAREGVVLDIAQAAAAYIASVIQEKEIVVVGRGRMVKTLVNQFEAPKLYPEVRIVPMQGVLKELYDPLDAAVIASQFGLCLGTEQCLGLPAPAIVSDARQRACVRELPIVKEALSAMQDATLVITSIASINQTKMNFFSKKGFSLRSDRLENPVGEIGGWLYYDDGEIVSNFDLGWYPIGMELTKMRALVESGNGKVVCAVGGDIERIDAILGALNGHLFNVLITDHVTAKNLMQRMININRENDNALHPRNKPSSK